jgi:hypothetical protein
MASPDWLAPRVRTMQIIAFAITNGAFLVTVILAVMRWQSGQPPGGPLISLIAAIFFVVTAICAFVLPEVIVRNQIKQGAIASASAGELMQSLVGLRQTSLIIRLALLEGSAFFAAIVYLIEGQPWVPALAAVDIILMLSQFPTQKRVLDWLETQAGKLRR